MMHRYSHMLSEMFSPLSFFPSFMSRLVGFFEVDGSTHVAMGMDGWSFDG